MLTGNEKAWAAFIIGTIVQSLDIVIAYIPPDQSYRVYLLVIVGIVGTIGQGLGVYQIMNTPKVVSEEKVYPPNLPMPS